MSCYVVNSELLDLESKWNFLLKETPDPKSMQYLARALTLFMDFPYCKLVIFRIIDASFIFRMMMCGKNIFYVKKKILTWELISNEIFHISTARSALLPIIIFPPLPDK